MGGAFAASRVVVIAVRYRKYDPARVPWQIMTPVYSSVLGWVGVICIRGGLFTLAGDASPVEPRYTFFVVGLAFLSGFASEVCVKRLIRAAESLFGENIDPDLRQ
jgi:hypothetical protein